MSGLTLSHSRLAKTFYKYELELLTLNLSRRKPTLSDLGMNADNPMRLSALPLELLYIIFEFLGIADMIHLGLTCNQLWRIAKQKIAAALFKFLGNWARTPTICVGDGSNSSDHVDAYPPELLNSDDKDELQ